MTQISNNPSYLETIDEHPQYGRLVMAVGFSRIRQIWRIIAMIVPGFLFVVTSLALHSRTSTAYENFESTLFVMSLQSFSALCIIFLIYTMITAYFKSMRIYEHGVICTYGKQSQGWTWEEFDMIKQNQAELQFAIFPIEFFDLTLYSDSKPQLKINMDYAKCGQIAEFVIKQVKPIIMKRLIDQFDRGETLHFGNVEISQLGIKTWYRFFYWGHVKGWKTDFTDDFSMIRVHIITGGRDDGLFFRLNDRPNGILLLEFLEKKIDELIQLY